MKKLILSFLAISMVAAFSSSVMAQTNTANASSDAFATIVAPISITHDGNDLQFGTIISGAGWVKVDVASARTFEVAGMNPGDQGATPTASVFSVAGQAGYTYGIAFTNATEDLTVTGGGTDVMTANSFIASTSSDGIGTTGTLDGGGADVLTVGATLAVTTGLEAGTYEGTFEVTVNYN